jgi:DNA-binding CsgD family transcriptional regulator
MRHLESRSFVGRAAELTVLEEVLAAASGGAAAAVLIGGEAGVGKTRLVAELAARAREQGAAVATGACVELTAGTAPDLAITEVLRDLGRALPERAWERLRAGAGPELGALLPGGRQTERVRADAASRARMLGQVHDLLTEAASVAPLVLVLEDVHWADRSTLDLAAFLVRALGTESVVLLCTYRTDEVVRRPSLREWLAEVGRVGTVRRLELAPFTGAELADLCAAIVGDAATPATIAEIFRRSGGNAFLAEELLDAAAEGLPASVRDVLEARIAALSPAAQEAVRAAAVAGARIDDELLAALLGGADPADALREAVAHHVLVADPRDGRLSFRHELTREAAYASLLPGERRRLHGACAAVLSARPELGGDAPAAVAAAIAGHWQAAGDERSALAASVRAAIAAEGVHAFSEAAELYDRALTLWDRVDDAAAVAELPRLAVLDRAAAVLLRSGGAPQAVELLEEALELADPVADPVGTGLLHSRLAWTSWAAGRAGDDVYRFHDVALALIPAEPATAERAQAVTDLAFSQMLNAQHHAAVVSGREGIALARDVGDRRIESLGLTVLGSALGTLGQADEAIACLREAVAIARAEGLPEEMGRAYVNLTAILDTAGRLEESAAVAREGSAACRRLGLARLWGAFLTGNAAEALVWLGRWDEAEELLSESSTLEVERTTSAMHLALTSGRLAFCRGDLDACEAAVAAIAVLGTGGHAAEMQTGAATLAAELAIARGRPDEARRIVRDALERPRDDVRLVAALVAVGIAAEAARPRPESVAYARELIGRLDPNALGATLTVTVGETATARAELSRLTGPDPEPWRAAAAAWEARPAPYRVAYCRWREAEALLAAGASRSAAAEPLRAAAATARELGARALLRELEILAARARIDLAQPPPAAEPEPDPHGLTPREREILPYLAAGRTNRQIAEALFISPRTAGAHVSRILAKLGASTRGEAAAAGRLAGLVDDETIMRLTPPRKVGRENPMRLTPPRKLGGAP